MIKVYYHSDLDPEIVNEYLIESQDNEFLSLFVQESQRTLNDPSSSNKQKARSQKYLTSFKNLDSMIHSVLTELNLHNLLARFCLKIDNTGDAVIVNSAQTNPRMACLNNLLNTAINTNLSKNDKDMINLENDIEQACLYANIEFNLQNPLKTAESLFSVRKEGKLIRLQYRP